MTDAPLSPITGKPMIRDVRPMALTYKGQSVTIQMPGWYCANSGESIHTGEDMTVSDAALKTLKIKVEKLLTPEEIKRIRQKLGLTQREAGEVIGGGPNAFQKYESGDVLLSKGMSNFLRVLEKHPEEVRELKEQAAA
jgi:HTH-type transcriptional regulator / antitoxin MqsA